MFPVEKKQTKQNGTPDKMGGQKKENINQPAYLN